MDVATDEKCYVHIRNESMLTFKEMWNRDDLSDVQLCCGQQKFNVHRFLLAACSPYFESLFQRNSCEKLNIVLENVKCADLQRVLTYMYEGSVFLKNDNLQGFGELLEMFLMPLPADMIVSCDADSDADLQSNKHRDDYGYDGFIANVRKVCDNLTVDNLIERSTILFGLANGSAFRFEAIVNILLQNVIKVTPNCPSRLLSSLVKMVSCQDQTKQFQGHVRLKSVHVLRYLLNAASAQHEPFQLAHDGNGDAISALDREVARIGFIGYHWDKMRRRRFTHFIAELFATNIVSYTDIFDLKQLAPELASDLILKRKFDPMNCCDFNMPATIKDIINNDMYRFARQLENDLFCLRVENNQSEKHEFNGLINGPRPNRSRKRKRTKRTSVESTKNINASKSKTTRATEQKS